MSSTTKQELATLIQNLLHNIEDYTLPSGQYVKLKRTPQKPPMNKDLLGLCYMNFNQHEYSKVEQALKTAAQNLPTAADQQAARDELPTAIAAKFGEYCVALQKHLGQQNITPTLQVYDKKPKGKVTDMLSMGCLADMQKFCFA
jgi:hypothetical protein